MEIAALYLPQFHNIPENDEWWGEGFTEWTNVKRALPLFRGHQQPNPPGELGYYSLLDPAVRQAQATLASEYGITSFCYWHYWFGDGKVLLEKPLLEVLDSGEPDFPFFVGWANHSWTGKWVGAEHRMLIEQTYPGPEDDRAHFKSLLSTFRDGRYVTFQGRPVFLVFDPKGIPHRKQFVERWQGLAKEAGLPGLYMIAWIQGKSRFVRYRKHRNDGFDAGLYVNTAIKRNGATVARDVVRTRITRFGPGRYKRAIKLPRPPRRIKGIVHLCVQPNWDNTPRSSRRGLVVTDASPETFETQLTQALTLEARSQANEQLVVIKSWNEWAEGNYLEPDLRWGRGWLEAVRRARRAAGIS